MNILVITSCTNKKKLYRCPAEEMYLGEQHKRLMAGVNACRQRGDEVDLRIVSAKYGVIDGATIIDPYNITFKGMARKEIRRRADELNIPAHFKLLLQLRYSKALVLLGDDYLSAVDSRVDMKLGSPTTFICAFKATVPYGVSRIDVDNNAAREYGCGMLGLRGELARRWLASSLDRRKV